MGRMDSISRNPELHIWTVYLGLGVDLGAVL